MLKQLAVVILLMVLGSASAWAIELHDAKNQGLVGEANSGYLAAVKAPVSDEVQALLNAVNAKRASKFQTTAQSAGLSVDQVAARFYQRAVQQTAAGNLYQDAAGNWLKK